MDPIFSSIKFSRSVEMVLTEAWQQLVDRSPDITQEMLVHCLELVAD